jgi:hypothetical protein
LLDEKEAGGDTEIMTVLSVTNTGRLNYHLKVLGDLVSRTMREGITSPKEASLLSIFSRLFPREFQWRTGGHRC